MFSRITAGDVQPGWIIREAKNADNFQVTSVQRNPKTVWIFGTLYTTHGPMNYTLRPRFGRKLWRVIS